MTALATGPEPVAARPPGGGDPRRARSRRRWPVAGAIVAPAALTAGPWFGGWVVLLDLRPGPLGTGAGWLDGASLPAGPAFHGALAALAAVGGSRVTALAVAVALLLAAWGGARLAGALGAGEAARATAAVAAAWNPFVFDRLHAGQLATVAAAAVLLHLAAAACAGRRRQAGALLVLAAGCSVQFLVYGALVVAVVGRGRLGGRGALRVVVVGAVATAAWLLPVVGDAPPVGPATNLDLFATRSDPDLGRALGVAVGSGFWRQPAAPVGAALGPAWAPLAIGVLGVAVAGLVSARRRSGSAPARDLAAVAVAGWLLAMGAAGPAAPLTRWAYAHLPGFPALREAHKAAALVVVGLVAGLALAADRLHRLRPGAAWAAVALPLLLAPGQAWGLGDRVRPSAEPEGWADARAVLAEAGPAREQVVVLPWVAYHRPVLAGGRLVGDVSATFVVEDALRAVADGDGQPAASDPAGAAVEAAVAAGAPGGVGRRLGALGVGWVVAVEDAAGVGADLGLARDPALEVVVAGDGLVLYRVLAVGAAGGGPLGREGPDVT